MARSFRQRMDTPWAPASKSIAKQLRKLRAEMRAAGIKKTSPFNGGMDRETYRYNARRFELETKLEEARRREAESVVAGA